MAHGKRNALVSHVIHSLVCVSRRCPSLRAVWCFSLASCACACVWRQDLDNLNGVAWPALLSRPAAAAHAAAEAEAAGAVPDDDMGVAWRVQSRKEAAAGVAAAQQLLQVRAHTVRAVTRACACVRKRNESPVCVC